MSTTGDTGCPAGRRSVATQVTKMRPFGDASYFIEALRDAQAPALFQLHAEAHAHLQAPVWNAYFN